MLLLLFLKTWMHFTLNKKVDHHWRNLYVKFIALIGLTLNYLEEINVLLQLILKPFCFLPPVKTYIESQYLSPVVSNDFLYSFAAVFIHFPFNNLVIECLLKLFTQYFLLEISEFICSERVCLRIKFHLTVCPLFG